MKVNELMKMWDRNASGELAENHYTVRLPVEDAARIAALCEMYPKRSAEDFITDLLSAALSEIEGGMPYIKGDEVIAEDEMGDPIYEDAGSTPRFLALSQKHLKRLKAQRNG
ncbi:pilin assembly protein [Marinimicrobium alkaliphilum]|uniref:pilin assembly protein n=1 Tax=Marinimicrobium alkaliphilum TaxID=2202654 RepID=UPI000DB97A6D|nr:pilin assembly protein [Marinimicrobium alkaliphilum]